MQIKGIEDVARVERTKAGELLNPGTIMIRLSANNGDVLYVEHGVRAESGWVKFTAKQGVNSKYLYYQIRYGMEEFLQRYKTGINLKFEEVKHIKIRLETMERQKKIVEALEKADRNIREEEKVIEMLKEYKRKCLHLLLAE